LFVLYLFFTLIANILNLQIAVFCNIILVLYLLLIFFHSGIINKSVKIAFLSILTSIVQLVAYGFGFIQDLGKSLFKLR
jgi:hypothetical protein